MSDPTVHRLISADSHVNAPIDMWAEYLPAELRAAAPRLDRTDEGDFQVFEGKRKPIAAASALAGFRPEDFTPTVKRYDDVRPGGWEPAARIEDQDIDGVDAEVIYGNVGDAPLAAEDPVMARASFTAYNRWLADFCSYDRSRLVGIGYVPCEDPDDAIAEARLIADLGLRGVVLSHLPAEGAWRDERWAPFLRTLTELGLPAHLHVSVGTRKTFGNITGSGDVFMNYLVNTKLDMPLALGRFVLGGVLAQHPELRLVSVEAQIGWIPFWKYYIDHVYERHRFWTEHHLDELPSTYVSRQVWFTFMEDPPGIDQRHACGVDRIMWSSDYPHSETTWPHSQKIAAEIFEHVPADEARRIVRDNAAELYGI